MDKELRNLLVEVARGVLRALAPDEAPKPVAQPAPKRESVQATQAPAAPTTPTPAPTAMRGSTVRVWNGSMYVVGVVDSISRGEPRRVKVRVKRAGSRDKLYTVDPAKAEVLK